MKKIKWLMFFAAALFLLGAVEAQTPAQSGAKEGGSGSRNSASNAADTAQAPGNGEIGTGTSSLANPPDLENNQSGNTTTTPGLIQTTSSASGSPSVLSEEQGRDRDGTNTVQRGGLNMAGSPVDHLDLAGNKSVDVDEEIREQPQTAGQTTQPAQSSGAVNDNTRKENNTLSDQGLSSGDNGSKAMKMENGKAQKKKKDKG